MAHPWYGTPAWRSLRRKALERAGFECEIRLPKCRGRANAVDHVVEWQHDGIEDSRLFFSAANLQAACVSCNSAKRNRRQAELARRSVRAW